MQQLRITLVDAQRLVRDALGDLLGANRLLGVTTAASLAEVPADAGLVALSVGSGDWLARHGEAIAGFRAANPACRFVVLAEDVGCLHPGPAESPVDAVLSKDLPADMIGHALELVSLGLCVFSAPPPRTDPVEPAGRPVPARTGGGADVIRLAYAAPARPAGPAATLSPREHEILRHLAKGASNKTIARNADITEATVKVHVKTLLRKLQVSNRTQAAVWAMTHVAQPTPAPSRPPSEQPSSSAA